MKWFKLAFLVLGLWVFLSACSRPPTVEEQLLGKIDTLCKLAEAKDLDAMMAHFAEDFVDFQGERRAGSDRC